MAQAMDALDKKDISSAELTRALLDRIDDKEPKVRALNTVCAATALAQAAEADTRRARGEKLSAFDGIPAVVKDNICTEGMSSRWDLPPRTAHFT